jgi:hypothetical protein
LSPSALFCPLTRQRLPDPISQEELRAAFNPSNGWKVAAIEVNRVQTRYHDDGAPAWFATIKRI